MQEFFTSFADWFTQIFDLLSTVVFRLYGYNVSLLSIIMALFVLGFITNFFWKGAKV